MNAPRGFGLPDRSRLATIALRGRHLLVFDIVAVLISYTASFVLRFDAPSPAFSEYIRAFWWPLGILVVTRIAAFFMFGLYQRVWRYASVAELKSIALAVLFSSLAAYGLTYAVGLLEPRLGGFPRSIPVIETLFATALMGLSRFSLVLVGVGRRGGGAAAGASRALIVGAGSSGAAVARQLLADEELGLTPVGFVDDRESVGHRLLGLPVLGPIDRLDSIIRDHGIGTVLFALPHVDGPTLRRLVRIAVRENARSLTVPSMSDLLTGQTGSALREVQVEDLLRRSPAHTDLDSIRESFRGTEILVTGAGGSIGAELSRQLLRYAPRRLLLLGRGENSIYELLERLTAYREQLSSDTELVPVIMDVKDTSALKSLFRRYSPDAVFHAAAHKHVGLMELYPEEAVATNVLGTQNLLDAVSAAGVSRFVFVSTDKAVRPTSVMGATKRIGELLVRNAAAKTERNFVIVRFGNVLSSRGSVVPRFRRQLADGGALTVTHPQARRYFMTVDEAVQLILQASILGEHGATYVLDMGEPVLIDELARDLIELHGLVPNRDVRIVYTGLGQGEKLDEELFLPHERPRKTVHDSIWIAADSETTRPVNLEGLRSAALGGSAEIVVDALRLAIPEYHPARDGDAILPAVFKGRED